MNAFKRLIARLAREGCDLEAVSTSGQLIASRDSDYEDEGALNITVKAAIGGRIVQFRHHDRVKDRNTYRTYIITDAEPFETSLGKIITMETMRI